MIENNKYTLASLMNRLRIMKYPARWEIIFTLAMEAYGANVYDLVDDYKLREINNEYHIFTHLFDTILIAAKNIRENEPLARFLALLDIAMSDRLSIRSDIDALELPQAPDGVDPLGYDLVSLFVFPKRIAATYAAYREHHVPEYIINSTMREYENSIDEYKQRFGKIGFSIGSLNWGQDIVDTILLRIMRLNFELLPEFGGQIKVFRAQTGEQKTLADGIRLHCSGFALGNPALEDDDGSYN